MKNKKGITPSIARRVRAEKGLKETKLLKIRAKRGLSQADLAKLSGVPLRAIQSYEQGERAVDGAKLQTLCMLCSTLNCKIEDILQSEKLIKMYKGIK